MTKRVDPIGRPIKNQLGNVYLPELDPMGDLADYSAAPGISSMPIATPPPNMGQVSAPNNPAQQKYQSLEDQALAAGPVHTSLLRTLAAGATAFTLAKRHPGAADIFSNAILDSDPKVQADKLLQRKTAIAAQAANQERQQNAIDQRTQAITARLGAAGQLQGERNYQATTGDIIGKGG